jgi:hypothetical protein
MKAAHRRGSTIVGFVAEVELALPIAQYWAGLWTNLYGPAVFADNTSLPALHYRFLTGDLLFGSGSSW